MKTDLSLKKLKGIKPKGKKVNLDSSFKEIVAFYNELKDTHLNYFAPNAASGWAGAVRRVINPLQSPQDPRPGYDDIYMQLRAKNIEYSQSHIHNFLNYFTCIDPVPGENELFGVVSGCLLDFLTQKMRRNNEHCVMHVSDVDVPILFYGCNNIDTLVVDNHNERFLLSYAGVEGVIKNLIFRNANCSSGLLDLSSTKSIDLIWVENCNADMFGQGIMEDIGALNYLYVGGGSFGSLFYGTSEFVRCPGASKFAYLENIKSDFLLTESRFDTVVVDDCEIDHLLQKTKINHIVLPNHSLPNDYTQENDPVFFNIYEQEEGIKKQAELKEKFKVDIFKDLISKIDYTKPTQTKKLIKKLNEEFNKLNFGK